MLICCAHLVLYVTHFVNYHIYYYDAKSDKKNLKIGKVYVDGSAKVSPRLWGCTAANVGSFWSLCSMVKMARGPSIVISLSLLFRSGQASSI